MQIPSIISPIQPFRGLRNTDAYGSGTFGASRDDGKRIHLGRDYIAIPGETVVAPVAGEVTRIFKAYPDADLTGLEISFGTGILKLLYLSPTIMVGSILKQADPIGTVQDVAWYWHTKAPKAGEMTNHIHMGLMIWMDPERFVLR